MSFIIVNRNSKESSAVFTASQSVGLLESTIAAVTMWQLGICMRWMESWKNLIKRL